MNQIDKGTLEITCPKCGEKVTLYEEDVFASYTKRWGAVCNKCDLWIDVCVEEA